MEFLVGVIYKITNKITGMSYVGQTVGDSRKRLYHHSTKHSQCIRLKSSIKSHGIDSFVLSEIEKVSAPDAKSLRKLLSEQEIKWIKNLNTLHPNGYNLTSGGHEPVRSVEVTDRIAKKHWKPVKCLENGQIWESVKACAEYFGVKPKQISRVLKGQRKRLKWSYTLVYYSNLKAVTSLKRSKK